MRASTESEREWQHQNGDRHAEAAEGRPREQQLNDEADHAEREVEGAKETRERVGVSGEALVGDQAQLERRPLGHDGYEEDERRHEPEVRAGGNLAQGVTQRIAARRGRPRHGLAADSGVGNRDNERGQGNQRRENQQHVHRAADRTDEIAGNDAAGDGAKRRSGADEPEEPLRLARVEQGVCEAPRLDRAR